MTKGYRIPDNDCACVEPGTTPSKTRPTSILNVRSFITNLKSGSELSSGSATELKGIAFDGGNGIKTVEVSIDGGKQWSYAKLGVDLGRFSFREWRLLVTFKEKGRTQVLVRATSNNGEVQPDKPSWNPAGYLRNVVESISVIIA